MDTSKLERFAKYARRYLVEQVSIKLDKVLADGSDERRRNPKQVQALEEELKKLKSKDLLIDKVAYTWFNRFCALRFMDVNRYTRIGILSPLPGQSQPEILAEAKMGHIDEDMVTKDIQKKVYDLLSGTAKHEDPQSEAYRILIIASCNYYALIMPFLFERIADWTELLMPDDLLSDKSLLTNICETMTQDTCKDVEVIGWLYQYYISERHNEVVSIAKGKKIESKDIPAATQLFTPHWIVKYMIQNTLGRLWMLNNPNSALQNQMEFYIRPVDPIQDYLRIKSPEEIKLCDPCSGSGHILTYAFDLLYQIYSEMGYEQITIPKLIITKNLFGIEIDERAGELGAFALTMKAREKDKTWFSRGIKPNICLMQNVRISDSEIDSYMDKVGRDIFTQNFENTLRQFEYADTYGALIVPEEKEISQLLGTLEAKHFEEDLFLKATHDSVMKIIKQTDYLNPKYHVVVTNPPYMNSGGMNELLKVFINDKYSDVRSDLFSAFIIRNLKLTLPKGQLGFMTPFVWMFISSYEKLRKHLITNQTITSLIQLEYSGFEGATVPICTFTLENARDMSFQGGYVKLSDFRGADNQAPRTIEAIDNPNCGWFFNCSTSKFYKIPGSPIAYWISQKVIDLFSKKQFLTEEIETREGLTTGCNELFLRFWHEVSINDISFNCQDNSDALLTRNRWFPYVKGGDFKRWSGNFEYVVNWFDDGAELRVFTDTKTGRVRSHNYNNNYAFKMGFTWSGISSGKFSVRRVPSGFMFDAKGPMGFPINNVTLPYNECFLNSKVTDIFLKILAPTLDFKLGHVLNLPLSTNLPKEVVDINSKLVELSYNDWLSQETYWDFNHLDFLHTSCIDENESVRETYRLLRQKWIESSLEMQQLELENNRIFLRAYGLQDEFTPEVPLKEITLICNPYYRYQTPEECTTTNSFPLNPNLETRLLADTISEFISYAVGCMLGRYSIDKPGLILANQGETIDDYLKQVPNPSFMPDKDNVIPILDGEWFTDDVAEKFKEFLKITFGDSSFSQNLQFIEEAIGKDLRSYFLKDFYNDHIKRYKKRPIYWLFSSPKGSFNALIYMHRYTPDTVSIILNDYLREFVVKLNAKKADLEHQIISSSTTQRDKIISGKELERITAIILELENWERDIIFKLAAAKIEIDLDDGVKVNYAKFGTALKKIPGLDKSEE